MSYLCRPVVGSSPKILAMSATLLAGFLLPESGILAEERAVTPAEQFAKLLEDSWQNSLREWPLFATRSGEHRYNDRLAKVGVADAKRRAADKQQFLERLRAIPEERLSGADKINYALFKRELEESLADFRFQSYLTPINNRTGFHIDFPELHKDVPLVTTADFENYISRLAAFSDYADGHIELMREGVRAGITVPAVILEGWEDSVTSHIVEDPTNSLLYEPLKELPDSVPESERTRLRSAAKEAISSSVVPGYKRFEQFMASEYVPNCRTNIGASALPEGRDFYRHRVRVYTTLDTTPEEVHARGLAEVKRIREEMMAIIEEVGFETDREDKFAAFTDYLRTDERFYAKSEEELLQKTAYILKRADGELPKMFGLLPRMPYGIREVPDYIAPKTTTAYYQGPSGDGTTAGFYYLNTYNLPSRPLYSLEALSLHEAVPGHHLQIALQQELEGLPNFRKFGGFTAFIEGWALYAERLGLEMGFYEDPYSDFGRLTMEIWRAGRLVVDTGIHYKGWTRDRAIEYMLANSAMSQHNVRAEIDRYIGWPGQALAYKTGELKIRELRETAETQLGEKFNVRSFHDVVLGSGAVPLDVLEANVKAWIAEQGS